MRILRVRHERDAGDPCHLRKSEKPRHFGILFLLRREKNRGL